MLSTKSIFQEIRNNPEAFSLLLSIAAKGELQGGWENERIAALTEDTELAQKVRRHGADETKHGLMFSKLLRKAGLDTVPVPFEADYCMRLEKQGLGLSHDRLIEERPLSADELLKYLVHSKITEERAAEEVHRLLKVFQDDGQITPTLCVIADDEINHLSYAHEELLKLSKQGQWLEIKIMLKIYALVEIGVYRDVGLVFVDNMSRILGWGKPKQWLLKSGVLASYFIERTITWHRLVALRTPLRMNAMGGLEANRQTELGTD